MKTILTLKGARKYKAQLEEMAKAYAEFEKTLNELQLQDGINVIEEQKKTVQ